VIDHIGITCADYAKSQQSYDAVLGALGFSRQMPVVPSGRGGALTRFHPGYFGAFTRETRGRRVLVCQTVMSPRRNCFATRSPG
jgi:catechol 2,3-dioxygenase-like lactoylglutathione lyase family enzyme